MFISGKSDAGGGFASGDVQTPARHSSFSPSSMGVSGAKPFGGAQSALQPPSTCALLSHVLAKGCQKLVPGDLWSSFPESQAFRWTVLELSRAGVASQRKPQKAGNEREEGDPHNPGGFS